MGAPASTSTPDVLAELRALPIPTIADSVEEPEGLSWEMGPHSGVLDHAYLSQFVAPRKDRNGHPHCIACGEVLVGWLGLGTFTWSLQHGSFFCGGEGCGWPGVFYHYRQAADGTEVRLQLLWQLHPDAVERRTEAARG